MGVLSPLAMDVGPSNVTEVTCLKTMQETMSICFFNHSPCILYTFQPFMLTGVGLSRNTLFIKKNICQNIFGLLLSIEIKCLRV